ncbi:MAG: hypothetical protein NUK65_00375 [Firmicutes bacterium]|nr:hypothetical protein [Bacillota bacterium]
MTVINKRIGRLFFVTLCFMILVISIFGSVVYAETTGDEDLLEITVTVSFIGGPDTVGEAPAAVTVVPATVVALPENTFVKENYNFIGWTNGTQLYVPGDAYEVLQNETFSAQWEEQVLMESEVLITDYTPLEDLFLLLNGDLIDLTALISAAVLPTTVEVTDGIDLLTIPIIDWVGTFDGTTPGSYTLTALWDVPVGYQVEDNSLEITINVIVEEAAEEEFAFFTLALDECTINGTDEDDIIIISSHDGGMRITVNGVEIIDPQLLNISKLVVNGGAGDDIIYLDITTKPAGLTELVILGGLGEDTISTQLACAQTMDLAGVTVLFKAEQVLFAPLGIAGEKLVIRANNLTVHAAPTGQSQLYATQNIKVVFTNVDIQVTGDFMVDATSYISNGQEVESEPAKSTVYEIVIDTLEPGSEQVVDTVVDGIDEALETVVNVAAITVAVELDTTIVSANNVSLQAITDMVMNTGSEIVPVTVTVADILASIIIKGDSYIQSLTDILCSAYASVKAVGDASSDLPLPLSLAVMVLDSQSEVMVMDTSKLSAGGNITLVADNIIEADNLALGAEQAQSGGFFAVTVVKQKAAATLKEQASVIGGANVTVSSMEKIKTQTLASSGNKVTASGGIDEEAPRGFSFDDLIIILTSLENPAQVDEAGNVKKLVDADTIAGIVSAQNESTNNFAKEDETTGEPSPQIVGAVAIAVVQAHNEAAIDTIGQLQISGLVSVLADAVINHIVEADASAVANSDEDTSDTELPFGMGVGVAVGIVHFKNDSFVGKKTKIGANGILVRATSGDNFVTVGAKAGYNKAAFGAGGAVAVTLYTGATRAYIADNATIQLTGNQATADMTVCASDNTITETLADASSQDESDTESDTEEDTSGDNTTGVGSGIAVSIFKNEVSSSVGKVTINGMLNHLIVSAISTGYNHSSATAGASGGIAIVPVVAVTVVYNYVGAKVEANTQPLIVVGDVLVQASGTRNTQTEANADAGGDDVAIGAAVAIALIDLVEEAYVNRSIGTQANPAHSIVVVAVGVNCHEVSAYAGRNGGQEDASDSTGDEEGSITSILDKITAAISALQESQNQTQQNTTNTAKEQKAGTTEGTLNFAASLALTVVDSRTSAAVGVTVPVTIYTGDLSLITRTNKDAIANANATATNGSSEKGVGAAAAIIRVIAVNQTNLGNGSTVHASGNVLMKTIMEVVEETVQNELGEDIVTMDEEHNYGVVAQSGAGGSVFSLAGAVALSFIETTSSVVASGTIEAGGDIDFGAHATQYIETMATAVAVKTIAGKSTKKRKNSNSGQSSGGIGIGASFAMANLQTAVAVKTAVGTVLKSARETKVKSSLTNRVTTTAEAGQDVVEDDEGDPAKLEADYEDLDGQYNKTSLDAAVAIAIINLTVESTLGASLDSQLVNITVGQGLLLEAESNSIIKTTSRAITEALNAAAGATVSLNLITQTVTAEMAGYADVVGAVVVCAKAYTVDESDAYATSKGVQIQRHAQKFGISIEDLLDGVGGDTATTASQRTLHNDDVSNATQTQTVNQTSGQTAGSSKISIAAAIAVSIIEHHVTAIVSGKIINASTILISADNENNFLTYATGVAVNNGNALAVAVAVAINNSKNYAVLGSTENISGDITVIATTLHNLSEGFRNKISAQAIAGSKAGTDGKFGAAGAVATLVSNAETKAYVLQNMTVATQGTFHIEAKEKSKLAVRAWGASLITKTTDGSGGSSGSTVGGIGAAFAILHANNQVLAYIGNGTTVLASAVTVHAIKEKVDHLDYEAVLTFDDLLNIFPSVDDLMAAITQQSSDSSTSVSMDTATITTIMDELNKQDLLLTVAEYINYIATNNYYVEAAGGSIASSATNAKFSGAGSFALMYFANVTSAYLGEGVTITLLTGSTELTHAMVIEANSDVNLKAIGGSVASGGDTSVGLTAIVINNNDETSAYVGKGATTTGFNEDLTISALAVQNYLTIAIGAAVADINGIAGIANVMLTGNKVLAYIGSDSTLEGVGNLTITAENSTYIFNIVGGISYGKEAGIGVSCLFLTYTNETEAYIGDGVWVKIGSGAITIDALANETIITVSANGAASQGSSLSVGPSLKIINAIVKAFIGSDATIEADKISIHANSHTYLLSITGSVSVSFGQGSIGAVADSFSFGKTVHAYIGAETDIVCGSEIELSAIANEQLISFVVGIAISKGVAGEGSASVHVFSSDIAAYLGDDVIINFDNAMATQLTIVAENNVELLIIAGGLAGSTGNTAVGISTAVITFNGLTQAYIGDGARVNASVVAVNSMTTEQVLVIVASGSVSSSVTVNGAIAVLVFEQETAAYIGKNATLNTTGGVNITADDVSDIVIIAGNIGVSGKVAVGAANITGVFNKLVTAYIGTDTAVFNNGNHPIYIEATNTEDILFVAIGLGGSGNVAVQGSIIVLVLEDTVTAFIAGNTNTTSAITTGGNIVLLAENSHDILNIAGSAVGSGTAAIGIASAITTFNGSTRAYIGEKANLVAGGNGAALLFYDGSVLGGKELTNGILLAARHTQLIENWVISGGGSGTVTVTGSVNVVVMQQKTEALVDEVATLTTSGHMLLLALDATTISNRVGTAGGAGTVSVGVSSDTIAFSKKVWARILDGASILSAKNIIVHANSKEAIHVIVAGVGGAGTVAINAAVSVIVMENDVVAYIGTKNGTENKHAMADADGSIVVLAEDDQSINVIAGSANGSGTVSAAAGSSVIVINNQTNASAGRHADVNAYGLLDVLFYTGEAGRKQTWYKGLLIGAYSVVHIEQIVFCASGSGAVAAAGAVSTLVSQSQTQAQIQSYARINQGNRQVHQQSVRVVAVNESSVDAIDGGAAGSLYVGIGAAAVVIVEDKQAIAAISEYASVYAKEDIDVIARTNNSIKTIVVSMGGAVVGVSGSAAVVTISDYTHAYVGASAFIEAGRDVLVAAYGVQSFNLNAGSLAGGAVGVGGAVVTLTVVANTLAIVYDNATIIALNTISFIANSTSNSSAIVAGAGIAGYAASGSVFVLVLNSTTQAMAGSSVLLHAGQELLIKAEDKSVVNGLAGGAAYGGSLGVGGAVDVILYRNTVTAGIGSFADVRAGFINIIAIADRTIIAKTAMLTAGNGAVSGSVIVISVGAATDGENTSKALQTGDGSNNTVSQTQTDINGAMQKSQVNVVDNENNREHINKANAALLAVSINLGSFFTGLNVSDKTTAFIGSGGTTTATTGDIIVKASEKTTIDALAGAVAAGQAALGGAVIVVTLHGTTESYLGGTIQSAGHLSVIAENTVQANKLVTIAGTGGPISLGGSVVILQVTGTAKAYVYGHITVMGMINVHATGTITTTDLKAYAGAVGGLGLGAAVAIVTIAGDVSAFMASGTNVTSADGISVKALSNVTTDVEALGAAAGVVAMGICIANVNITIFVTAYADHINVVKTGSFAISAAVISSVQVVCRAATGGIIASGSGAVARIEYKPVVTSYLSGDIHEATGKIAVQAIGFSSQLQATATGAAIAVGLTAGVSLADIIITPHVTAYIGSGSIDAANAIEVVAYYNLLVDENNQSTHGGTISAKACAGAAGALAGLHGAIANIVSNGTIRAYITEQTIIVSGDILVSAGGYQSLVSQGGGISLALGAAIGAVYVSVNNQMQVTAYIQNTDIETAEAITINAVLENIISAHAMGTAGGLLVAGGAQIADVWEKSAVHAYVSGNGNTLRSNANAITLLSHNGNTVSTRAEGCALAGFIAGGYTKTNAIIENSAKLTISSGITLWAFEDIMLFADSVNQVNTYSSASAVALGGSVNDVDAYAKIFNTTAVAVGASANLYANKNINIQAIAVQYYSAYATAIAGGFLAIGVARAQQDANSVISIAISDYATLIANGFIYLQTDSRGLPTGAVSVSHAIGGAGGAAADASVLSRLNTTVSSTISTGTGVEIRSNSNDVTLYATGIIGSRAYSKIKFTVAALSFLATVAKATNVIHANVILGNGTRIEGMHVIMHGEVAKVDSYVEAYSETASIVNTQSRPWAYLHTTAAGGVYGTNVTLIGVSKLGLYGTVNHLILRTYSYGYTAGGTGSIISTSENYVRVHGTVNIQNGAGEDVSVLKGKDIEIIATSPRESETVYVNVAEYKADTVVEYVLKAITKVMQVVEKVTQKVVKKLPWPLNKIVSWVVRTVVRTVTYIVNVLVEVILQSETDTILKGNYISQNNVILNGHIYYGANVPIAIIINEYGDVSGAPGLGYVKDEAAGTITLESFVSAATGSLNITSYMGRIAGNVVVYTNAIISEFTIINHSNYHLIINGLNLVANDSDTHSDYNFYCSTYDLVVTDATEIIEAPIISITSTKGKDIIFNGKISTYSATLIVLTEGNVYMNASAALEVNQVEIYAHDVGRAAQRIIVYLFLVENSTGADVKPQVIIHASGDIYASINVRRYIDNIAGDIDISQISLLDGARVVSIIGQGVVDVIFPRAALIVAEKMETSTSSTYTYEYYEIIQTPITDAIEAYWEYEKILIEDDLYLAVVYNEATGSYEYLYFTDADYTQPFIVPDGYRVITENDGDLDTYYLLSNEAQTGYRYVGGDNDGQEYEYDEDSIIIFDREQQQYYLVTTILVTIVADLPETITSFGSQITVYAVNGVYYIEEMQGNKVDISVTSTPATQNTLVIEGSVSAVNTLSIRTYHSGDILITGSVTTSGSLLEIVAAGIVEINGDGQIRGDLVNTDVYLESRAISTNKTASNRVDLAGKTIEIITVSGVGSSGNPIAVDSGIQGLSVTASAGDIDLVSYISPMYVNQIISSGLVALTSKQMILNAWDNTAANILAATLKLQVSEGGIGESTKFLLVNTMDAIDITASGSIYLKQLDKVAILENLSSLHGSVYFVAENNINVIYVSALASVYLESLHGAILDGRTDSSASIVANEITLVANNTIGTQTKDVTINIGEGMLTASAQGSIYLIQPNGDVKIALLESISGSIVFTAQGDIQIDTVRAKHDVFIQTAGSIDGVGDEEAVNIEACNLVLRANGAIGAMNRPLVIYITGTVGASAEYDIVIVSLGTEDITIASLISEQGNIYLTSIGNVTILEMQAGNIIVEGQNDVTIEMMVSAETNVYGLGNVVLTNVNTGNITVEGQGDVTIVTMLARETQVRGLGIVALTDVTAGNVIVEGQNDVTISVLIAESILVRSLGDVTGTEMRAKNFVDLKAVAIYSGGLPEESADIFAPIITLQANDNIGTAAQFVTLWQMENGTITVTAGDDIFIRSAGDVPLNVEELASHAGGIIFTAATTVTMNAVSALTDIAITVHDGNLHLLSIITKQKISIMVKRGSVIGEGELVANIFAQEMVITASDYVGSEERPLLTHTEFVSVLAGKDIELIDIAGDIVVKQLVSDAGQIHLQSAGTIYVAEVKSPLQVRLVANGGIYASGTDVNVTASDLYLYGPEGIGLAQMWLVIALQNEATLHAYANGSIYLAHVGGQIHVIMVESKNGDVWLTSTGDLLLENIVSQGLAALEVTAGGIYNHKIADGANIRASAIELQAQTEIGEKQAPLVTDVVGAATIKAYAATSIYLTNLSQVIHILDMQSSEGDIVVMTLGTIYIASMQAMQIEVSTDKAIYSENADLTNLSADNIYLQGFSIGERNHELSIETMLGNLYVTALEGVYIKGVQNSLRLGQIQVLDGPLVLLSEVSLLNGLTNEINIMANGIEIIVSNGDVGTKLNPITMDSVEGSLVQLSAAGSIYLNEMNGSLLIAQIFAGENAEITAAQDMLGLSSDTPNVVATQAVLIALEGNIGSPETPLTVSSSTISAFAKDFIHLKSSQAMDVTEMVAQEAIFLEAFNISGGGLATKHFEAMATNSLGSESEPFSITVQTVALQAGYGVYVSNTGDLRIENITARIVELEADSIKMLANTSPAIVAFALKLVVKTGIGEHEQAPFAVNVNRFTGQTAIGSIYFKNAKSIVVANIVAPTSVYLLISGSLTGNGLAVTTGKFIFNATSVDLIGSVKHIEGRSRGNVVYVNRGACIIGGADAAYEGITAGGSIAVTAMSPLLIQENVTATGQVTLFAGHSSMLDDLVLATGTVVQSLASAVHLYAGDQIVVPLGARIQAATAVMLVSGYENLDAKNTSLTVLGKIQAATTTLCGGATMQAVLRDTMGSVTIIAAAAGSKVDIKVESLGGDLVVTGGSGRDHMHVDMSTVSGGASRKININGSGGNDEYYLLLAALGQQNIYTISGAGTVTMETTHNDESLNFYHDRITLDAGRGAETLYIDRTLVCVLRNLGGDNRFDFYDTPCKIMLETGNGNDSFQLGKITQATESGTRTTEGWLSRGTSHDLEIKTSGGNNSIVILSAKAPLRIVTGDGNDLFTIKAFIEELDKGQLRKYENAAIVLDGGGGSNQLTMIKSAYFDLIKLEAGSLVGSGFDLSFNNMGEVGIVAFTPAQDATDTITTGQLIKYSVIQLAESKILYVMIAILIILAALVGYLSKKKKRITPTSSTDVSM